MWGGSQRDESLGCSTFSLCELVCVWSCTGYGIYTLKKLHAYFRLSVLLWDCPTKHNGKGVGGVTAGSLNGHQNMFYLLTINWKNAHLLSRTNNTGPLMSDIFSDTYFELGTRYSNSCQHSFKSSKKAALATLKELSTESTFCYNVPDSFLGEL